MFGSLCRQRSTEEETLGFLTLLSTQEISLPLRFNSFSYHLQVHTFCHSYDGTDDGSIFHVVRQSH